MLGRERDYRGGAAEGCRDGCALERIGVHDACGRKLLDMGVAVDTARQHQLAPRVDLPPRSRQPSTDSRDRLAGNGDVGLEHVACGCDASAADEQVVGGLGHDKLPGIFALNPKSCIRKMKAQIVPLHALALLEQTVDHASPDGMVIASIVILLRADFAVSSDASSRRKAPCRDRAFSLSIPTPTSS
jgi:hypothetical protein